MTVQEAKMQIQAIPSKIWEQLSPCDNEAMGIAVECMEELEQYRALGTVEELKEAREKQVAKKVLYRKEHYGSPWHCPICEAEQIKVEFIREDGTEPQYMHSYCWHCGNKIDWKEGGTSD